MGAFSGKIMVTNTPENKVAGMSTVLNAVDTPILMLSMNGKVVLFNHACEKLSGYAAHDIVDQYLWDIPLLSDTDRKRTRDFITLAGSDSLPKHSQMNWLTKDGKQHTIDWSHKVLHSIGDAQVILSTGNDTSRHHTEQALHESERRYQRLVETMQEGLIVQDARGTITYANQKLCQLLGYTREELNGRTTVDLVDGQSRGDYMQIINMLQRGEKVTDEIIFWRKAGTVLNTIVGATPLIDPQNNQYKGNFAVITDITRHKQTEEALRQSNAELDAFAHTVAHDLKSPLSVMTGFASILESDYIHMPDAEMRDYLQTMSRTSDKMINIIDELLLLSEMRHTDMVDMQPLDTAQIITEALERLSYMVDQYQATIIIPDKDAWLTGLGHAPWVEEVWVNYISNAIKYGGQPPRIELGSSEEVGGKIRFWVQDNGKGIPEDKLTEIFMPFTRLDKVRAKGHGLGLSIVQRIIDKLNGEVAIASEPDQGSRFSFILPAAK